MAVEVAVDGVESKCVTNSRLWLHQDDISLHQRLPEHHQDVSQHMTIACSAAGLLDADEVRLST